MALGKFFNLSDPEFSPRENRDNNRSLLGIMRTKWGTVSAYRCLAQSKHLISIISNNNYHYIKLSLKGRNKKILRLMKTKIFILNLVLILDINISVN